MGCKKIVYLSKTFNSEFAVKRVTEHGLQRRLNGKYGVSESTLRSAKLTGATILFPKTKASDYSFVAEIEDSEGNRIGIIESLP